MRRVLLDTNIVLDVLLKREPWVQAASAIWRAADAGQIGAYISANTVTDIFYIARKVAGWPKARVAVQLCFESFGICTIDRAVLESALALPGSDFEDNLQLACAVANGLEAIISRDMTGFEVATLPVFTAEAFVQEFLTFDS